ncbi:MAG: fumarylacetoacetate hydrolase family protein [Fimbriimonas sp.]
MKLSRHLDHQAYRWNIEDRSLPLGVTLSFLLSLKREEMLAVLASLPLEESYLDFIRSPVEPEQEVWASGVTYLRSRDERQAESTVADVYAKVYEAERPELFFKAAGWRTVGHEQRIRVRQDSQWDVPEPELTLVINSHGEIVGYTAGNDVSSRSIEGENPLYLPQAKSYDGSCAVGPTIVLACEDEMANLKISCAIKRGSEVVFQGETSVSQMKRKLGDLVGYLFREMSFPHGVFLMTGTGIIPTPDFTLLSGDIVTIEVGEVELVNEVQ